MDGSYPGVQPIWSCQFQQWLANRRLHCSSTLWIQGCLTVWKYVLSFQLICIPKAKKRRNHIVLILIWLSPIDITNLPLPNNLLAARGLVGWSMWWSLEYDLKAPAQTSLRRFRLGEKLKMIDECGLFMWSILVGPGKNTAPNWYQICFLPCISYIDIVSKLFAGSSPSQCVHTPTSSFVWSVIGYSILEQPQVMVLTAMVTLPAFNKDTLSSGRWLVGAGPVAVACNVLWHSLLTVDDEKQVPCTKCRLLHICVLFDFEQMSGMLFYQTMGPGGARDDTNNDDGVRILNSVFLQTVGLVAEMSLSLRCVK